MGCTMGADRGWLEADEGMRLSSGLIDGHGGWKNEAKESGLQRYNVTYEINLQVDESTVSKRLKGLGMIQKQGHWVPYELKPRTTASTAEKKRFFASHRIVTGDEKWIHYDNPKRRKSWGQPGHASRKTAAIRAKT
ncbi:MOS1T transposase, partial [Pseudoatta argentina]